LLLKGHAVVLLGLLTKGYIIRHVVQLSPRLSYTEQKQADPWHRSEEGSSRLLQQQYIQMQHCRLSNLQQHAGRAGIQKQQASSRAQTVLQVYTSRQQQGPGRRKPRADSRKCRPMVESSRK